MFKSKQIVFLLAFFLIFMQPFVSFAQKPGDYLFSISAGAGLSKLHNDSLVLEPTFLPAVSVDFHTYINQKTLFSAGLQYSLIGGNANSPVIKFRNQYLGFNVGPRYYLLDFLFVEANVQYSNLLKERVKVLDGTASNGMKVYEGTSYNSQFEVLAGLGIKLENGIHFRIRYTIPTSSIEYQNLQFMASFDLSAIKIPSRKSKFYDFDEALMQFQLCQSLILQRKEIATLSPEINKLINLQELFLDGNNLKTLPAEIGDLEFLLKISIRHNALISLPPEIGRLENLEELHLEYNQLTSLPDEIGQLKSLRFLYIGKNYLTELPASIGDLTNLVELDISNSGALLRIPPEIEKLKHLELLIVDHTTVFPIPFNPPNARLKIVVKD